MRLMPFFAPFLLLFAALLPLYAEAACSNSGGITMGTTYASVCNNGTAVNVGCGTNGSCSGGDKGLFRLSGNDVEYCNGTSWFKFKNSECVAEPGTSVNCALPWGGTLANGASVTAYSISTDWPSACGGLNCPSQTRTCTNGVLSGGAIYSWSSCSLETCCGSEMC